ncbi:hypothetical protein Tco_0300655 [Tanacetum coccineum]
MINWTELKRLLTNKYCPRTEVKKMEDEFYNLVVKRMECLKLTLEDSQDLDPFYAQTGYHILRNLWKSFIRLDYPKYKEMLLYCLEASNIGGSHQHSPEINGSDNKA